jgi:hypothetical protein
MHSNLTFINFDTNYVEVSDPYNFNPFDTTFVLSDPLRKVKNIYLKSIELPVGFTNVRDNYDYLTLQLYTSGRLNTQGDPITTDYNVAIPKINYTTISSLLTAINTEIKKISYYTYSS